MGSVKRPDGQDDTTVDFASVRPRHSLAFEYRFGFGGVTLVQGSFQASEGTRVRSSQVLVALHESEPFRLEWRGADSDRLRSSEIARGHAHVGDGRPPFWVRSHGTAAFFAIAMEDGFVRKIWEESFDGVGDFELRTAIGVRDRVIDGIGLLGRHEMNGHGASGRLYAESLGTALAVHLLRQYGTSARTPRIHKGGLTSRVLQRVVDHINAQLESELSLGDLARTAGLSPHHFASAFKATTGTSPHRYVIERRIDRARELLRQNDKTISEIAYAVGFSSQSHLTANFHRTTGITPRRFRQARD
jgi:AraC family transcriptional regulator